MGWPQCLIANWISTVGEKSELDTKFVDHQYHPGREHRVKSEIEPGSFDYFKM